MGAGSEGFFGYCKVREIGRRYTDDTQMMMGESNRKLAHPLDLLHNENLGDLAGVAEWEDFFSPPVRLNLYESVPLAVTKSTPFPSHYDQSKKVPKFRPGRDLSKKVAWRRKIERSN